MLYWKALPDQIAYCTLPVNKTFRHSAKGRLFVIGYWLMVISYWLLVISYWLLAIGMKGIETIFDCYWWWWDIFSFSAIPDND